MYTYVCALLYADGDERITGDDATKFFAMSNIEKSELKQVKLKTCSQMIDLT